MTEEIVAHLRRPETHVIEGVGRLPNLEAQPAFDAALRSFLTAHAPR